MTLGISSPQISAWGCVLFVGAIFLLVAVAHQIDGDLEQIVGVPSPAPVRKPLLPSLAAELPEKPTEFKRQEQTPFNPDPRSQLETESSKVEPPVGTLEELHHALETMQTDYFKIWLGKWPDAIDWTSAVMGTHVSAALYSLTRSLSYIMPGTLDMETQDRELNLEGQRVENEINKYFSQAITYFFGEDHFAIRTQAYDDMLWVVLGWMENIRFIREHNKLHYPPSRHSAGGSNWYGKQFESPFAHRARVFYDLATKGWDWKLCGGGMIWDPHPPKPPYKNAITNELFITASIGMYLYFPGDSNCSPFMSVLDTDPILNPTANTEHRLTPGATAAQSHNACEPPYSPALPHDPIYLASAINGYNWLKNSNMTNVQGLYVDGFHIRGWKDKNHIGTGKCDERNNMVYTYNQGVLLSGLRGLWEGTGNLTYLEDGHKLVRDTIRATGWKTGNDLTAISFSAPLPQNQKRVLENRPVHPTGYNRVPANPASAHYQGNINTEVPHPANDEITSLPPTWAGLGADGIMMEFCDPAGTCSQNAQTFKGIFFHHLTIFCTPLPLSPLIPGKTHGAKQEHARLHRQSCKEYAPWVARNAEAALETRDGRGRFGMWWGAPRVQEFAEQGVLERRDLDAGILALDPKIPVGAIDYQNLGFMGTGSMQTSSANAKKSEGVNGGDANERGRGRTVETQGGGVAVVRAMWEFVNMFQEE
ncbi:glycoside hydrolase family 76 protein [Lepidopterella palustris CBS 459.81]|uniref:Glycoside hydrolase family 76 protein n=1 Tax=Lepidopterella palustris CBS 459.81 TaxID=1314670 RepID=A0A8E2E4E5_9PEZI|nr:glycoside hydrolase family 76 protein [Lepidopterella palustris CBS 459.81]